MKFKTLPIFMAFLLMGVADAMGPLSDAVKTKFQLSSFMATLMPFFVFIAFAIFSVPGGVLAARIGKKKVLLCRRLSKSGINCLSKSGQVFLIVKAA